MMKTQRIGGIAAFLEAACYIVGFCIFIFFLDPPSQLDPVGSVEYLIANETLILSAMIFIYIFVWKLLRCRLGLLEFCHDLSYFLVGE